MRIGGPLDTDEERDSILESRIAHLETEPVATSQNAYFNKSDFPTMQNSMANGTTSTFFEQRDLRKSTKGSSKKGGHKMSHVSGYSHINQPSLVSAAVGPSNDNRQSQAAGRSSYYTARSFAVGPSELDKQKSMAAGTSRSIHEM